jgi:hypothetical protein
MKKLNKLQINPERLMKNEELLTLRGGSNCACTNSNGICAIGTATNASCCEEMWTAAGCTGWVFGEGY